MAVIVFFQNPLDTEDREIFNAEPGTNLKTWLDDHGFSERMRQQPLLVLVNGQELMEDDYDRELTEMDRVAIAAQAEGLEVWVIQLIVYAVVAVALYLSMPEPVQPGETEEGSSTYNISSRGNKARLGQPKPVLYGEMRTYPDLASKPYHEFDAAGDQYVYQLFEVTQGIADVDESTARFEDTNLSSFDSYEIETVLPGAKPALFPSVVDVSSEVSNLDIIDAGLGPYTANPAGTTVTRLAVDAVAPVGVWSTNSDGDLRPWSVQYKFEARAIDDNDVPTGSWFELGTHKMEAHSRDPIRRTHFYTVADARYEVKVSRLSPKSTNTRTNDAVTWSQLRSYIADSSVTTTTRIAVKIRASEQVGNKALSQFNVVSSRKLKKWNSGTGWSAEVLTSNPAWAFADALRENHGGNRSDAYIDLVKLEALAPALDTEGVEFNGVFDTKGNLWDSLTSILMPARCRPVDRQGLYTLVRDSSQSVPAQMFSMRNIVKDSFKIDHAGILEETADSVRIEFFDKDQDYRPAQFTATLNGGTTNNPRDVKLFGITDKDQAHKIAQYMNAQNFYRRQRITFETGIEGRIPFFGDLIGLSHFMLGVQDSVDLVSGDVVAFDGVDVVTLTEDVDHIATPYIVIRDVDGSPTDAWTCTAISKRKVRITDGGFTAGALVFDPGYERPHFTMGEGVDFVTLAKVEKVTPASKGRVKIDCYVDDPAVYTAADGLSVPPITQLPSLASIAPVVNELAATVQGETSDPVVYLTWHGDNSDHYEVEVSIDGAVTYLPAGQGRTTEQKFSHMPPAGIVHYRVAGVNLLRGSWTSIQVDTNSSSFIVPADPTALALAASFVGSECNLQWSSETYKNLIEFWVSGVKKYSKVVEGTTYDLTATLATKQGIGRAFDVRVYAVANSGVQSAGYASLSVSNPAPALLNNLAVIAINNAVHISFDWPADTDLSGISVWVSDTPGFAPGAATLEIDRSLNPVLSVPVAIGATKYVKVAAVDVWDSDANYSGQFTVTGNKITATEITDSAVTTPLLAAGAVTADKAFIVQLSTLSADLGLVTAGTVKTTSGTGNRVEISSSGTYPIWVGSGPIKNLANSVFALDGITGKLTIQGDAHFGGSLSAATGTFAGTLTAAAINAVDTINLNGNAVSVMAGADASSWGAVSVTIIVAAGDIPSGQSTVPIIVTGSCDSTGAIYFDMARNPANLTTSGNLVAGLPPAGISAYSVIYDAAAGTHTFWCFNHGAGDTSDSMSRNRSITATLGKR